MKAEHFLYLIINLFSLFLIKEYLKIFFEVSSGSRRTITVWIAAVIWQICATYFVSNNGIINLMVSIIMILFIAAGAYQGSIYKKIIFVMLINIIWMLTEVLTLLLFVYIGFDFATDSFFGAFLSKLFTYIVIKAIDFWGKKKTFGEIPFITGGLMLMVPLGSVYIACYIFYSDYSRYGYDIPLFQTITYLIILLVNMIVFILYEKIAMEYELQRNSSIFQKQLESCRQNALLHKQMAEEVREIRHDLKYQIFYIQNALENKEYDEAKQFLGKLDYLTKLKIEEFLNTSNLIVDSLINYEYSLAKSEGIKFSANVEIGEELAIEDGDICLLLGNMIDNAREAAAKVDSSERFIKLYMKEAKKTLILVVQNSFINCLKRDWLGNLLSSKEDEFYHGVGLSTIKKIVEKYNGTYTIDTQNQVFTLKVLIYLE